MAYECFREKSSLKFKANVLYKQWGERKKERKKERKTGKLEWKN